MVTFLGLDAILRGVTQVFASITKGGAVSLPFYIKRNNLIRKPFHRHSGISSSVWGTGKKHDAVLFICTLFNDAVSSNDIREY